MCRATALTSPAHSVHLPEPISSGPKQEPIPGTQKRRPRKAGAEPWRPAADFSGRPAGKRFPVRPDITAGERENLPDSADLLMLRDGSLPVSDDLAGAVYSIYREKINNNSARPAQRSRYS